MSAEQIAVNGCHEYYIDCLCTKVNRIFWRPEPPSASLWQPRKYSVTIPPMTNPFKPFRPLLLLAVVGVPFLTGCVERKITLGSDPEGAVVTLNDEEVGRTPVTTDFLWYGDYDVVLRLDKNVGTPEKPDIRRYYLHTHKHTKTPAFQIIGIDLLAEVLPFTFKDEQVWAFSIPEVKEPADQELIQRAHETPRSNWMRPSLCGTRRRPLPPPLPAIDNPL